MADYSDSDILGGILTAREAALRLVSALRDIQQLDGIFPPITVEELIRALYYQAGVYEERVRRAGHPQP